MKENTNVSTSVNTEDVNEIKNEDVNQEHEIIKLDEKDIVVPEVQLKNISALKELKVAADPEGISQEDRKRNAKKLAGAISHALRNNGEIDVRAFGSAAIGKAAKALAIAKDYIGDVDKLQLAFSPGFITTKIGENTLTGICFYTFAEKGLRDFDISKAKSVLMVKADPKEITPEERRLKVRKLAGAITHAVEENKCCVVRCFGNATIAKASKALAIARGFTASRGPDLYCWNDFIVTQMGDKERTGIAFFTFVNS
jgi:stage V sporulation protein S